MAADQRDDDHRLAGPGRGGRCAADVGAVQPRRRPARHPARLPADRGLQQIEGIGADDPQPDAALGLRRARAATAVMLALPGSAYLYQGEELGLPEATQLPDEVRQDPTFARTGGTSTGRDGCRVPCRGRAARRRTDSARGDQSWLPQPAEYGELAADRQTRRDGVDPRALHAAARGQARAAAGAADADLGRWLRRRRPRVLGDVGRAVRCWSWPISARRRCHFPTAPRSSRRASRSNPGSHSAPTRQSGCRPESAPGCAPPGRRLRSMRPCDPHHVRGQLRGVVGGGMAVRPVRESRCRHRRGGAFHERARRLWRWKRRQGRSLTWYINPDAGRLRRSAKPARRAAAAPTSTRSRPSCCPQSATEQRIQLLRRLAAEDPSIDLMSLDPVFTAEFADAGCLAPFPDEPGRRCRRRRSRAPSRARTWDDKLVAAPLWANTQVLWYRKSLAEKAGLDMTQPVTWDQIIDAAAEKAARSACRPTSTRATSCGSTRWSRVPAATSSSNTEAGPRRHVDIDSEAGRGRRRGHRRSWPSKAAEPDLSVSNEGTVLGPLRTDAGGFMVNWTFVYNNYSRPTQPTSSTTSAGPATRETVAGRAVAAPDRRHQRRRRRVQRATRTSRSRPSSASRRPENQVQYAVETGNMPARQAAYDDPELRKQFPADLLALCQDEHRHGRPAAAVTPYWATIVDARPAAPGTRPTRSTRCHSGASATFIERRPPAERRCCEPSEAQPRRETATDAPRPRPARDATASRAENRLGWKLVAPGRRRDAAGHRLSDVPGALPVAVPVPADRARRPASSSGSPTTSRCSPTGCGGSDVVRTPCCIMVVTVGGRARDRLRLRHGDAPHHLRPRGHPHRRSSSPTASSPSSRRSPGSSRSASTTASSTSWLPCVGADYNWFGQPLVGAVRDLRLGDLEDHAVHVAAAARRPGADPGGHARGRARSTAPPGGSGSTR